MFLHDFSETKIKERHLCSPQEGVPTRVTHRKESPLKHKGFVARVLSVIGSEQLVEHALRQQVVGDVTAFVLFTEPMISERKRSLFEIESCLP